MSESELTTLTGTSGSGSEPPRGSIVGYAVEVRDMQETLLCLSESGHGEEARNDPSVAAVMVSASDSLSDVTNCTTL